MSQKFACSHPNPSFHVKSCLVWYTSRGMWSFDKISIFKRVEQSNLKAGMLVKTWFVPLKHYYLKDDHTTNRTIPECNVHMNSRFTSTNHKSLFMHFISPLSRNYNYCLTFQVVWTHVLRCNWSSVYPRVCVCVCCTVTSRFDMEIMNVNVATIPTVKRGKKWTVSLEPSIMQQQVLSHCYMCTHLSSAFPGVPVFLLLHRS